MSGPSLLGRLNFIRWRLIFWVLSVEGASRHFCSVQRFEMALRFFWKICEPLYHMVFCFRDNALLFLGIHIALCGQLCIAVYYKHTRINGSRHLQLTIHCEL
jgi:hypothetical protein